MRCRQAQLRFSDHIDNALSARQTWEIDKHLAVCAPCARLLTEMRRTVQALQASPRHELPADFSARLQDRLAGLTPAPPRRGWLRDLAAVAGTRALPLWGAGAAACGLAALVMLARPPQATVALPRAEIQDARLQNVALSASDPLEDLAAANLAASAPPESAQESPQDHDADH